MADKLQRFPAYVRGSQPFQSMATYVQYIRPGWRGLGHSCSSHVKCRTAGLARSRRPVLPRPIIGVRPVRAVSGLAAFGIATAQADVAWLKV
jgi:hypothetical protein